MRSGKILVQPAKTNKSKCKNCKLKIEKDHLRVHVIDDRQFLEEIRKEGGRHNYDGEGLYRGYFQTQNGVIFIHRYFVHLDCYKPIHPNPYELEYFSLKNGNVRHKEAFAHWLDTKHSQEEPTIEQNAVRTIQRKLMNDLPKTKQIKKAAEQNNKE